MVEVIQMVRFRSVLFGVMLLSVTVADSSKLVKTVYYSDHYTRCKKQGYVIAWDLNGVLFTKQFGPVNVAVNAISRAGVVSFVKKIKHLDRLKKQLNKEMNGKGEPYRLDEHFIHVAMRSTDKNAHQAVQFLRSMITEKDIVNRGVALIMYELQLCGCVQGVLSNIWKENLELQIRHIKQEKPHYSYVIQLLTNEKLRVIPTDHNEWMHKPERLAYQTFLEKSSLYKQNKMTIFIDDKKENVIASIDRGLFDVAIHFTNDKQLRRDLISLGIPLKKITKMIR